MFKINIIYLPAVIKLINKNIDILNPNLSTKNPPAKGKIIFGIYTDDSNNAH
jgi:hypothetical protein